MAALVRIALVQGLAHVRLLENVQEVRPINVTSESEHHVCKLREDGCSQLQPPPLF